MVKPTINEITRGEYNRYILVVAAAKGAHYVSERQLRQNELEKNHPERLKAEIEAGIPRISDEKPVKVAVAMLRDGEICLEPTSLHRALTAGQDKVSG